ncbi:MAG: hypothetical protein KGJ37_06415, partial [Verrucomicrobiota bacterium]|nr:hypothetical protein [Verrucomicrobiota bacterium]
MAMASRAPSHHAAGSESASAHAAARHVAPLPSDGLRTRVSPVATYDFAHELNNLLAIVSGYSEICATNPSISDEQFRKYLNEIRWAARHASELARQLLMFSRKPGIVQTETSHASTRPS